MENDKIWLNFNACKNIYAFAKNLKSSSTYLLIYVYIK